MHQKFVELQQELDEKNTFIRLTQKHQSQESTRQADKYLAEIQRLNRDRVSLRAQVLELQTKLESHRSSASLTAGADSVQQRIPTPTPPAASPPPSSSHPSSSTLSTGVPLLQPIRAKEVVVSHGNSTPVSAVPVTLPDAALTLDSSALQSSLSFSHSPPPPAPSAPVSASAPSSSSVASSAVIASASTSSVSPSRQATLEHQVLRAMSIVPAPGGNWLVSFPLSVQVTLPPGVLCSPAILESLHKVLASCIRLDPDKFFYDLPDRNSYPEYYAHIEHPISLKFMMHRLDHGQYGNAGAFFFDLLKLCENCFAFNEEESDISYAATILHYCCLGWLDELERSTLCADYQGHFRIGDEVYVDFRGVDWRAIIITAMLKKDVRVHLFISVLCAHFFFFSLPLSLSLSFSYMTSVPCHVTYGPYDLFWGFLWCFHYCSGDISKCTTPRHANVNCRYHCPASAIFGHQTAVNPILHIHPLRWWLLISKSIHRLPSALASVNEAMSSRDLRRRALGHGPTSSRPLRRRPSCLLFLRLPLAAFFLPYHSVTIIQHRGRRWGWGME